MPASGLCLPCQRLQFTGLCCVQDLLLLLYHCPAVSPMDIFSPPVTLWWIPSELLLDFSQEKAHITPLPISHVSMKYHSLLCLLQDTVNKKYFYEGQYIRRNCKSKLVLKSHCQNCMANSSWKNGSKKT